MLAGPTLTGGDWRILVPTQSFRMVLASFRLNIPAAMVMFKSSYCGFFFPDFQWAEGGCPTTFLVSHVSNCNFVYIEGIWNDQNCSGRFGIQTLMYIMLVPAHWITVLRLLWSLWVLLGSLFMFSTWSVRFTQRNLWCINKFTVKHQRIMDQKPDLPCFSYGNGKCILVDSFTKHIQPPPNCVHYRVWSSWRNLKNVSLSDTLCLSGVCSLILATHTHNLLPIVFTIECGVFEESWKAYLFQTHCVFLVSVLWSSLPTHTTSSQMCSL